MSKPILRQWQLNRHFFKKSYAQVETYVVPHVALQKSGGLKPRRASSHPLSIRLNKSQHELVRQKAKQAEMSVSAFVKCLILGLDYDPHMQKLFLALNRELTAQGRNLNQIAKHLNNGGASAEGVAMLDAIRTPLMRALYAVKDKLAATAPKL
jgi:hypothetical protein